MSRVRIVTLGILLMVILAPAISAQENGWEEPISIFFLHHSTGENLIWQGGVREAFTQLGYEFWDHGYNEQGLVDPNGTWTGISWEIPGDDTDVYNWPNLFNQPITDPPTNAFSRMLQHDVIIFKSCFPNSHIYTDDQLNEYKQIFLEIRDVMDRHPDKLFIPLTLPPLVPNETEPHAAERAKRWAEYLVSDEYQGGHPNIAVFDLFNYLADEDGFLRAEYRADEWDSHPNQLANQTVGPIFVEFVHEAIQNFTPGEAPPVDTSVEESAETIDEPVDEAAETVDERWAEGHIDNFERGDFQDYWWTYTEGNTTFSCEPEAPGYESDTALHLSVETGPDGYASCGVSGFDAPTLCEGARGVRFMWRSAEPGLPVGVILSTENDVFFTTLEAPGDEWTAVTLSWDDFEGTPGAFHPNDLTGISFDIGGDQRGDVWIDDLHMVTGAETQPEPEETEPETGTVPSSSMLEDFEGDNFDSYWWRDTVKDSFDCVLTSPGYESENALLMTLNLQPEESFGCGTDWGGQVQDWSHAEGLRFTWKADTPGLKSSVLIVAGGTPFETLFETPDGDWQEMTLTWDAFERVAWADAGGAETFDPAQVESMAIVTGDWENPQKGEIWIDDIRLLVEGETMVPDFDKYALWTGETTLRGANIWQRVVVPALDGEVF